jgi:hypothetical protein
MLKAHPPCLNTLAFYYKFNHPKTSILMHAVPIDYYHLRQQLQSPTIPQLPYGEHQKEKNLTESSKLAYINQEPPPKKNLSV